MPYSFEMPKWWEMREGVTIPAIPIGKPMEGGKGYVPERNPYFKKFTTRTMRPVIDFDTCVKCTLCWLQCPDSLLRRDARRPLRRQHGVLLRLRRVRGGVPGARTASPWSTRPPSTTTRASGRCGGRTRTPTQVWLTEKINDKVTTVRSHGFRFRGQYEEELQRASWSWAAHRGDGIPARTRRGKGFTRRPRDVDVDRDGCSRSSRRLSLTTEETIHGSRDQGRRRRSSKRRRCSSPAARPSPRPSRWPTSTSSPPTRSGPTTRSCRRSPRRSPTASSWPSTSWPRASTASSRSSSTPPPWARASSAAPRAWAGCTRWSAITVTPAAARARWWRMVGNRALDDPGAFGVEHNDALVGARPGLAARAGSTRPRRRSTRR